jgi:hypothetical protein
MRQSEEFFGQEELVLVYIAKKLREARAVEEAFDTAGVDYLVEADTYRGGVLFVRELTGAFFYVREADTELTHSTLRAGNWRPYEPGA